MLLDKRLITHRFIAARRRGATCPRSSPTKKPSGGAIGPGCSTIASPSDHIRTSAAAASGVGRGREKRRFSGPRGHRPVPSPAAQAAAKASANPPRAPCGRAPGPSPPPADRAAALGRSAKAREGPNPDRSPGADREVVLWPHRFAGNRSAKRDLVRLGKGNTRQCPGLGDAGKAARSGRGDRLDIG